MRFRPKTQARCISFVLVIRPRHKGLKVSARYAPIPSDRLVATWRELVIKLPTSARINPMMKDFRYFQDGKAHPDLSTRIIIMRTSSEMMRKSACDKSKCENAVKTFRTALGCQTKVKISAKKLKAA
ncbi:hypothetical protein PoB_003393900 [Plakobranchus ocellatus]|uniref:Uncharacterized protein n=1 Tax=Plakobranchus ocellatus TaxID=259542 RepID=A0AAV4AM41_9GAST|nr:hypothetical protein PoB_003393900 [Plakobranchus ocellatus]